MSATPEQTSRALTGLQKLAALLIVLGGESAAQILKGLSDQEIEAVSTEMAKLSVVTPEIRAQVLREFGEVVATSANAIRGGADYAQVTLEKAFGAPKATAILSRVAPARALGPSSRRIAELESSQIANVLRQERAQTIALVASCLPARKASEVLGLLPAEVREQAVERMATLGATPVDTVERVAEVVLQKAGPRSSRPMSQPGGLKLTASVLNALDRGLSQTLLTSLEGRNPELVQALRQNMFTFEDVARLSASVLQRILREVDLRDLAMALKPADPEIRSSFLSCISKRAGETVLEEISFMGAAKMRDIEAAQLRIVGAVRQLESEGEIELGEEQQEAAV